MKIDDIYRQNENKWIDWAEFLILEVGETQESEHGLLQVLKIAGDVGKRAKMSCYCPDEQFIIEESWEGKRAAFRIRHKGGFLSGYLNNDDPPKQGKIVDWDTINFGKCRHGILCACIGAGLKPEDIESDVKLQKMINNLAHFAMFGFTQE